MIIKSKATVTKIKLPQLTPSHIRERSTRHSHARSVNPSPSPISKILQPTTPMHSTHHKNSYYHYTSIMKIDQTPVSEVEMFNCLYKPIEDGSNKKKKDSPLKRIRNNSNENFINNFIVSRDPRRSAPNLDIYPNYIQKPQQMNETKRIEIRNKIMEIYRQVEKLLENHKGYSRQQEKKQVVINLVKLRKEFVLLNQDFNDYYVLPKAEPDQEFKNRMDMLIKLFQTNKLQKTQRISVFGFDESFTSDQSQLMQFLSDQMSDQEQNYSTSQQSNENLSDVSGQINQSKRNAQQNRSIKQSIQRQTKIINPIDQLQIQQVNQQNDQTKQKRKSCKPEIKEQKCNIPKKYTKLNIENLNEQQDNQIIKYTDDEQQQSSENGTNGKETDTKRKFRNDNKVISRKNAIFGGDQRQLNKKEFRINTEGQMISVSDNDEKSSDNRRQSEETNRYGLENREDLLSNQEQIDEILNQVENELIGYQRVDLNEKPKIRGKGIEFNDINQNKGIKNQVQQNKNQNNKKQQQQSEYEIPQEFQNQIIDENGLIEALANCLYIYDPRILNYYRIENQYTSWDDDIDYIYCNEYQFK